MRLGIHSLSASTRVIRCTRHVPPHTTGRGWAPPCAQTHREAQIRTPNNFLKGQVKFSTNGVTRILFLSFSDFQSRDKGWLATSRGCFNTQMTCVCVTMKQSALYRGHSSGSLSGAVSLQLGKKTWFRKCAKCSRWGGGGHWDKPRKSVSSSS